MSTIECKVIFYDLQDPIVKTVRFQFPNWNKYKGKDFYLPFRTTTDEFEDETFKDTGKIKYFLYKPLALKKHAKYLS